MEKERSAVTATRYRTVDFVPVLKLKIVAAHKTKTWKQVQLGCWGCNSRLGLCIKAVLNQ